MPYCVAHVLAFFFSFSRAAEEAALNLKRPDSITVYTNNNSSHNESATSDIILHSPQQMMLTLRIRCMGKLHKITIDEVWQLVQFAMQIIAEVHGVGFNAPLIFIALMLLYLLLV